MPSTKQEQGGTGGKVRSAIGALKRLPLIRRTTPADRPPSVAGRRRSGPESASEEEAGPQPASPAAVSTQEDGVAAPTNPTPRDRNAPPSPAASVRSSRAPKHKLNSSSPASELPKSWSEWNWAYQNGYIDFDDPPPPPSDLWASDFVTQSGTFKPPRPANEIKRQRAVDSLNVLPPSRNSDELPTPPQSPTRESAGTGASDEPRVAGNSSFDGESAGRRNGGSAGSSVLHQKSSGGGKRTKRQLGPLHPALQQLATEAKQRFGVDATTVSLMSNDHQIFLGDSTCKFLEETDKLERDSTCCAHTMLKASTTGTQEPLVVLDFTKDWRFRKNGFAPYGKGFYAAAPILVPAPLGDDEAEEYPAGVFCLLGEQPRTGFDERDRRDLSQMAERASVVIRRYVEEQRRARSAALAQKQSSWRRSDKVRRARRAQVAFDPAVVVTPPAADVTPPPLRANSEADDYERPPPSKRPSSEPDQSIAQLPSAEQPRSVKRPPLPIQTSSMAPARFEQTTSEDYQYAGTALSATLDGDVRDALDLSTELVATSIEMDFAYIARYDVHPPPSSAHPASDAPVTLGSSSSPPAVEMISSFGRSHPAPQFSRQAHMALEHAMDDVVLYVRPDDALREARERGDVLTTGLLAKIATVGDQTYVLGCFSQEIRRVLNLEDVEFVKSFARDLVQYVPAFEEADR